MEKKNVLYGLGEVHRVIDETISDLQWQGDSFDLRLILMEGFSNAYIHGNQQEHSKPIFFRYCVQDSKVRFEIKDCGEPGKEVIIPKELMEDTLYNESGRGLFIIQSLADDVIFQNNTLIIEKGYDSLVLE